MASGFFDHRLLEILEMVYVHWGFCSLPRSFDLRCTGFFTINFMSKRQMQKNDRDAYSSKH